MEFVSNLVWILAALVLVASTAYGVTHRMVRISPWRAAVMVALVCLVLLPVISMSDDLLAAQQGALPLAAQTWRLAGEEPMVAVAALLTLLVLLVAMLTEGATGQVVPGWDARPFSAWLTESLRLRPPPAPEPSR